MTCTCHAEPPPEGYQTAFTVTVTAPSEATLTELRTAAIDAFLMAQQATAVLGGDISVAAPATVEADGPEWDDRPTLGTVVDAATWALGQGWAWLRGGRRG